MTFAQQQGLQHAAAAKGKILMQTIDPPHQGWIAAGNLVGLE